MQRDGLTYPVHVWKDADAGLMRTDTYGGVNQLYLLKVCTDCSSCAPRQLLFGGHTALCPEGLKLEQRQRLLYAPCCLTSSADAIVFSSAFLFGGSVLRLTATVGRVAKVTLLLAPATHCLANGAHFHTLGAFL